MPILFHQRPSQLFVAALLVFAVGTASVASGGQGNPGNGNKSTRGNDNAASARSGSNSGGSANRGGNSSNAQAAANDRLPAKLEAYRAAYIEASTLAEEAKQLNLQYQSVSAMTEAEFKTRYPNGDYAATLQNIQNLRDRANNNLARATAEMAQLLLVATEGRPLDSAGQAQLHRLLGIGS